MNFLTENPYESRRWDFGRPPRACFAWAACERTRIMISTQNGVRYEPPRAEGGARVPQSPMALSRDLLTTLTIVNAKDSLLRIRKKFRPTLLAISSLRAQKIDLRSQ